MKFLCERYWPKIDKFVKTILVFALIPWDLSKKKD